MTLGTHNCSMPGFSILHHLPELAQTHVHWVSDAIQPSHPQSPPSPLALKSFWTSGSFPMRRLFALNGQSIGASVLASVLPMNIQGWFSLGLTGWISLQSKRLSSLLQPQFKSIDSSVLSLLYGPTHTSIHYYWKAIALTIQTFVSKVKSVLLNTLSRFVIAFLPRSKSLWI